ncbi:unnamed protein product [Diatraea saccharalis]|uniref:Uncharacterized protein n=1 Tax=Diatraea saccharalis TaxID=40085 RepID=A0A9N9WHM7_9NEOP|nr:unnamed protein product [Diatraea saccharalis]
MEDGVTCASTSPVKASLLFTNRYYIRRVGLDGGATEVLAHNMSNAVALDMDYARGCLYWSDVTRLASTIRRACRLPPAPAPVSATAPLTPAPYQVSEYKLLI